MWNTLVQRASLLNWGQSFGSFGSFEAARREQHSCSVHQRWRAQPISPKTLYPAWLRLHISTEMYCFGPLQVRVGRWREKHWGLLFTFRRWWQPSILPHRLSCRSTKYNSTATHQSSWIRRPLGEQNQYFEHCPDCNPGIRSHQPRSANIPGWDSGHS